VSLLALPLVRLISPLHVPSLANCLQLGPAAIWTASCPVRLRRVSPGAKTPPGQPEIFGGAPQYTKPPPQPSIAPYTHSRPPPSPPAASVHSLLWIVWTKTPSPAAVAPAPEAPVNYPLPPAAPSAPSVPPVPLPRAPTPYQSRPIRVPSLASTPSSPVFGPFRAPIQEPIPPTFSHARNDFPHFQQKSRSMRPLASRFPHVFHSCGQHCGQPRSSPCKSTFSALETRAPISPRAGKTIALCVPLLPPCLWKKHVRIATMTTSFRHALSHLFARPPIVL